MRSKSPGASGPGCRLQQAVQRSQAHSVRSKRNLIRGVSFLEAPKLVAFFVQMFAPDFADALAIVSLHSGHTFPCRMRLLFAAVLAFIHPPALESLRWVRVPVTAHVAFYVNGTDLVAALCLIAERCGLPFPRQFLYACRFLDFRLDEVGLFFCHCFPFCCCSLYLRASSLPRSIMARSFWSSGDSAGMPPRIDR